MPPAARGALFEKTAPLDPLQKLLIKGIHGLQLKRTFVQTMNAFFYIYKYIYLEIHTRRTFQKKN
jgi:hypothetical protein